MYRIDKGKCEDCGYCNYVCPFQSLIHNIEEKAWEIDREKCKECGQCYDACITKAVLCDDDQKRVETIFINDNCIGCSLCKRACPADAISGVIKQKFNIDEKLCIKCGFCLTKCKKEAITATYRNVHGGEL